MPSNDMILGFLGKGGSGKSTVATQMTQYAHAADSTVLAVDADHNMDLAHNLGHDGSGPYIGGTFLELRNQFGLDDIEPTEGIFTGDTPTHRFSFTSPDAYSKAFTHTLSDRLFLMMSGAQSDLVLHGAHCSHSLAAPLKIYLPLLELQKNEIVIVDEKASVDAVSTGIPTGFDLAVVVAEPRVHSLRAAKQIADMLDWYDVPRVIVLNKYQTSDDIKTFRSLIGSDPFVTLPAHLDPLAATETIHEQCAQIAAEGARCMLTNPSRLERTIAKYKRNEAFQSQTA